MLSAVVLVSLLVSTSALPDNSMSPGIRLRGTVRPVAQQLHLTLDPTQVATRGTTTIDVDLTQPQRTIWLNARGLKATQAVVTQGTRRWPARFSMADDVEGIARLDLDDTLPAGRFAITIEFTGTLADDLDSLYRVEVDGRWYLFSQFEALGAREAFPCFDEPARKIPFRISVTHPLGIDVVGNTKTVKREVRGNEVTVTFAETKPLPTYLLALVGGPIEIVDGPMVPPTSTRPTPLAIRGIASAGKGALLKTSLQRTAEVVVDQERAFGIGYPWDKLDIVAVADFSAGAMENAGLITYRDTRLFVDEQSPLSVQKANLEVIAHETAHQWFGNIVTMAWWDDLWLNEAFATWMAARTVQRLRPDFDADLELVSGGQWAMTVDSLASARRIREPVKNRGDIDNAFDSLTYSKGAAVIGMFEHWIDRTHGAGTFLRGVTTYLKDHAFSSGTTADFLVAVSSVAGVDVAPAFLSLLDQTGVPLVQGRCVVDNGAARFAVRLQRSLPLGSAGATAAHYTLPICVAFSSNGKSTQRCALIDGAGQIDLGTATCPLVIHPNADGAGYHRFALDPPAIAALAKTSASMTATERLAFADSVLAAFHAGTIDFATALSATKPLVADPQQAIALSAYTLLATARDVFFFDDEGLRATIDAQAAALYQPVLNRLGLVDRAREPARDRERRAAVALVLVDVNAAFAKQMAAHARAWLQTPHTRIARDLLPAALRAYVAVDVVAAADVAALVARAKREVDPQVRSEILHAIAATEHPALVESVFNFVFDDELRVNERALGLRAQGARRRSAPQAFALLREHYTRVAARLPEDWQTGLVDVSEGLCTLDDAGAVDVFFAPKRKTTPGLDLALAHTSESIRLCAALSAHHTAPTKQAIRRWRPR